ncbi:MAG: YgjP-like metallopeptidase domain-containing protein, partial [Thermoplasmata archaeon]
MSIKIDAVVYSKRKHIMLKIEPDGKLIVHAPVHTSKQEILVVVQRHRKWIEKTRTRMLEKRRQQTKKFEEGERFLFLGKEYPLKIGRGSEPLVFQDAFILSEDYLAHSKEVFEWWYKNMAKAILVLRARELA